MIGQNTEKSSGNVKRLNVIQTPVKTIRKLWCHKITIIIMKRSEKTMEHESDSDTNCNRCAWYGQKEIDKGTGGLGNKRTRGDYLKESIKKIGKDTEKNPRDLRRLAVTQIRVKDKLMLL